MGYTPDMSVKVTMFDNEHKKLIALTDTLNAAMRDGKGKDVVSKVLGELANYTKTHFKNEENLMQKYNYAGYEEQKKQHSDFITKVSELQKGFETGNIMISVQTITFLNSWITNHIRKVDAQYGPFFNEKGLK